MKDIKITGYDKFKCIADKCNFTCCQGWDISVDKDTFTKWENKGEETKYILEKVKIGPKEENKYLIDKKTYESCPLLEQNGLCQIVKRHGEEYLSHTCNSFPRIINVVDGRKEFILSSACPEVVESFSNMKEKIIMEAEDSIKEKLTFPLNIREAIINIIQQDNIDIDLKLIIAYEMIEKILEHKRLTEEIVDDELKKYRDSRYLRDVAEDYLCFSMNNQEAIEEVNRLFLDIIQNYKDVSGLDIILKDISSYAAKVNTVDLLEKWDAFKVQFRKYNLLMENVLVSKVIANCVSDDVMEIAIELQLIIMEYLLVRYATCLKNCEDNRENIDVDNIKNNIVAFSRIIENNSEEVIDFIYESFEQELLKLNYLAFIAIV